MLPEKQAANQIAVGADLLVELQQEYDVARQTAESARRAETTALNALNEAQKGFDAAVATFKQIAPSGSDWKSKAYHRAAEAVSEMIAVRKNDREEIRAVLSEFKGKQFVNLRVWFRSEDGDMRPGKNGIAFRLDLLPEVMAALETLKEGAQP